MIYVLLIILMVMVCYLIVSVKEAKETAERIEYKLKNMQPPQERPFVSQIPSRPVVQNPQPVAQIVPQPVAQLPLEQASLSRKRGPMSAEVKRKISESLRRTKEEREAAKPSVQPVGEPPQVS